MKRLLSVVAITLPALPLQVIGDITGMKHTPLANMSDEDIAIYSAALADTLDNIADGATRHWENSATGSGGELTPLCSFTYQGMDCRLLQINNTAGHLSQRSRFTFCQYPQGEWVITHIKKKSRDE